MATDFDLSSLSTLEISDLRDIFRVLTREDPGILLDINSFRRLNKRTSTHHKIMVREIDEDCSSPSSFQASPPYDCNVEKSLVSPIPCPNPSHDSDDELEKLLSSLDREELLEIMKRIISSKKIPFSTLRFDTITDTRVVLERRGSTSLHFNDNFVYALYLREPDSEKMRPLRFVHRWSYGIYIMCLVDRVNNPTRIEPLSLRHNREPFIALYRLLFGLPYVEAEKALDSLLSRRVETPSGIIKIRAGRFNDCVRDINHTLVSKLGLYESIPFKIRSNNSIALAPEKIILPPQLLAIRFI